MRSKIEKLLLIFKRKPGTFVHSNAAFPRLVWPKLKGKCTKIRLNYIKFRIKTNFIFANLLYVRLYPF